ncbi:hypothetical protein HMPREF0083_02602 [Aneurinibacillus aneurinilyticus ATCC 12856]|uniref:Uncharacterized protein n=1 Tax=Aneurinibacillus aneurinilyticus ATCC 12856 TaxID=649747 RepID=U1X469_ANEAE|nr:hypothetical protein HMPREF0083_02602 [Aneurinibacillus aneurinilyticus ATCC 12856]
MQNFHDSLLGFSGIARRFLSHNTFRNAFAFINLRKEESSYGKAETG